MIELTEKITYKIDMKNFEFVKKNLSENNLNVCIIGIGRIGLPTALSFAKSGLQTTGVDINTTLINAINSSNFPLKDEPGYEEIFNDDDEIIQKNHFEKGDVGYMDDTIGRHRIINKNDYNVYSLHIYSPPFFYCK